MKHVKSVSKSVRPILAFEPVRKKAKPAKGPAAGE